MNEHDALIALGEAEATYAETVAGLFALTSALIRARPRLCQTAAQTLPRLIEMHPDSHELQDLRDRTVGVLNALTTLEEAIGEIAQMAAGVDDDDDDDDADDDDADADADVN